MAYTLKGFFPFLFHDRELVSSPCLSTGHASQVHLFLQKDRGRTCAKKKIGAPLKAIATESGHATSTIYLVPPQNQGRLCRLDKQHGAIKAPSEQLA